MNPKKLKEAEVEASLEREVAEAMAEEAERHPLASYVAAAKVMKQTLEADDEGDER